MPSFQYLRLQYKDLVSRKLRGRLLDQDWTAHVSTLYFGQSWDVNHSILIDSLDFMNWSKASMIVRV